MAAGTAVLPGSSNTFIPDLESSGKLIVHFSRNPSEFMLPRYVQYRPVQKDFGYYLRINQDQCARLVGSSLTEYVWPDGADRPASHDGSESFYFVDYRTKRYDYPVMLGQKAVQQAAWDILDTEAADKAQLAMTARTMAVHSMLSTSGNWDSSHVVDVTALTGNSGAWNYSTSARADIRRSVNYGVRTIRKDTRGRVKKKDLQLVMNPTTAHAISECQEVLDHIKQSPSAKDQLAGSGEWAEYGLPNTLFGLNVVVEDAVAVTSVRGAATQTGNWVMGDGVVYILGRPGQLVSNGGGPSYSTAMLFTYEDLTVERMTDTKNRREECHIVDDFAPALTAPASGIYFTTCIA